MAILVPALPYSKQVDAVVLRIRVSYRHITADKLHCALLQLTSFQHVGL
jgi:hypothetical protein